MTGGDPNIVHRRVPNIAAYLNQSEDWALTTDTPQPGDVIWVESARNHIGIVTTNGMVMHNIGRGQVADVRPHAYDIFQGLSSAIPVLNVRFPCRSCGADSAPKRKGSASQGVALTLPERRPPTKRRTSQ